VQRKAVRWIGDLHGARRVDTVDCDGRIVTAGACAPSVVYGYVVATWRALLRLTIVSLSLSAAGGIACALALGWHVFLDRRGLPDVEPFLRFEVPVTGHVYDSRGNVLAALARERRSVLAYEDLPQVVRNALLAAEDKRFFSHCGVDFLVLPRVLVRNLLHGTRSGGPETTDVFVQGGSTLTQQLVRGWFLRDLTTREREPVLLSPTLGSRVAAAFVGVRAANKLARKVEEVRVALWLERELEQRLGSKRLAKEAILARYASWVYLGRGCHGFAEAARYYFGRPLRSFTDEEAPEAALLAGVARSSVYAPDVRGPVRSLQRRNEVLALMAKNGWIASTALRAFQERPIILASRGAPPSEAGGVVKQAIRELAGWGYGLDDLLMGRVQLRTTVDVRIQALAVQALENGLQAYGARHPERAADVQGAVVVLRNRDAALVAEVGGRPIAGRQARYTDFDRATDALRQPGSAMKPIVYLAALRAGFGLDTPVVDGPIALPMGRGRPWKWIHNYDGRYLGIIPLREALARSRNAATVRIAQEIGIRRVMVAAAELGIESPMQPYPTTAIGASEVTLLELANAYRAMATGVRARPHVVAAIHDRGDHLLFERREEAVPLDEAVWPVAALQEALRGVVRFPRGTAHALDRAAFPVAVMGKTGTTSDFRDALFVGSTYGRDGLTVAVRIGFDDGGSLGDRETGARAALPVFRDIMGPIYAQGLAGSTPAFPLSIERGIDAYLHMTSDREHEATAAPETYLSPESTESVSASIVNEWRGWSIASRSRSRPPPRNSGLSAPPTRNAREF
jgi:penicillin-binding protein 1A